MNVTLSGDAWEQSTLPVANGGIGVRRATDVALPAYLSSVTGSHALVIQLLPQALHEVAGINEPIFAAALNEWQSRTGVTSVQKTATANSTESLGRTAGEGPGGESVSSCIRPGG